VQADSAGKGVKIDMLNPSAASSALEPRSPLLVPRYQNGVSVDQNIRRASGELVGIFAPLEPCRRPFHERTDQIELVRVNACPILDEVATWKVRWVVTIEQSESSNHNGEINPALPVKGTSRSALQLRQISRTDAGAADPGNAKAINMDPNQFPATIRNLMHSVDGKLVIHPATDSLVLRYRTVRRLLITPDTI
jgi:hypothetical protein